jgi:hypothetical protein
MTTNGRLMEWLPYVMPDKVLRYDTQWGTGLTCQEYYRHELDRFTRLGRKAELRRHDGKISLWVDRLA